MSEMNTKLLQIISYFGVNNQQRKIQEELFELQESIIELETSKIRDYEEKLKHVIEELADVEVLLTYSESNKVLAMYKLWRFNLNNEKQSR